MTTSPSGDILVLDYSQLEQRVYFTSHAEVRKCDKKDRNLHMDFYHGEFCVRDNGQLLDHGSKTPGVGPIGVVLLMTVLLRPGRNFTRQHFGKLFPDLDSLALPETVNQLMKRIRFDFFGETGKAPRFLKTISFNPDMSCRVIVPKLEVPWPGPNDLKGEIEYVLKAIGWTPPR